MSYLIENVNPPSMESRRFLPIKINECDSHFGKDDLFFYVTVFLNGPLLGVPSYSVRSRVTNS